MERKSDDVRITVWIPRAIHRPLKELAASRGNTLRGVIVAALAAFLRNRKKEGSS